MVNLREWALPIYTIMMQMAAGSMLILWLTYTWTLLRYGNDTAGKLSKKPIIIIFVTVATAMLGSHYHLSRPAFSIFAVLNFGSSWLSREVGFTVFFALLVGSLMLLIHYRVHAVKTHLLVGWAAVIMGVMTVYAMSQVYLLPTQIAWNSLATPIAFFCAMIVLGVIAVSVLLLMNLYLSILGKDTNLTHLRHIVQHVLYKTSWIAIVIAIVELGNYGFQIVDLLNRGASARASLDLMLGLYRVLFVIRITLLIYGVSALAFVTLWQRTQHKPVVRLLTPVYFVFLVVLISEVLGRFLFYAVHVRTGI